MDENPFFYAMLNGDVDLVLDLLNNGVDANRRWTNHDYSYTGLHCASGFGSLRMAKIFLDHGADIEATDSKGESPLAAACRHLQPEVVRLLVSRGANIERMNFDGWSPFHLAVGAVYSRFAIINNDDIAGCLRTVEVLVDSGANIDAMTNGEDATGLHLAIIQGRFRFPIAQFLVEHGANVNAVAANQETPLHFACSYDQPQTISLLLDHGATIDARDINDRTPLHVAILKGNLGCAEVLVDRGADIFSTSQGETPLKMAIAEGNLDIVFVLLRKDPIRILETERGQPYFGG